MVNQDHIEDEQLQENLDFMRQVFNGLTLAESHDLPIRTLKFKKLHPNAVIPSYAKPGDAGLDLTAIDVLYCEEFIEFKTGLAVEIPPGFVGLLFPRSSITKKLVVMANSVGVIDSGYRGELVARFKRVQHDVGCNYGYYDTEQYYQRKDRVAQLIVIPYPTFRIEEVDKLSSSERGTTGFGSTGR
jgi:dUTP pyrophosphatase